MTALNPTFAKLGVRDEIVRALAEDGIEHTFAIQELTLPLALAGIKDIEPLVPYLGAAFLGAVVLMAIALDAYFDAPVRAALLRLLKRRTVPVAISTAP